MKDLAYYRANAEEDYVKVPISVLRYISELENAVERMYSEEEVYQLLYDLSGQVLNNKVSNPKLLEKWFEQFKKK